MKVRMKETNWMKPLALTLAVLLFIEGICSAGIVTNASSGYIDAQSGASQNDKNSDYGYTSDSSLSCNCVSDNSLSCNGVSDNSLSCNSVSDNSVSNNSVSNNNLDENGDTNDSGGGNKDEISGEYTDSSDHSAVTADNGKALRSGTGQSAVYTVKFMMGSYAPVVADVLVPEGADTRLNDILPNMDTLETGYKFSAWCWDAELTDELTTKEKKAAITENKTVYAKYKSTERRFSISYELNGGKVDPNPKDYSVSESVEFNTPTKKGSIFGGWYKDALFTQPISNIPTGSYGKLTLYAKWEKINLDKVKINSAKNSSKGKIRIAYDKVQNAAGYEVNFSSSKLFGSKASIQTTKSSSVTLTNMLAKKTYYIKVRAYQIDSTGAKCYGAYSVVSKVKVNKGVKEVKPKSTSAKITSFKITGEDEVTIKATIKNRVKSKDEHYYLFRLEPGAAKISKTAKPIATFGKTASVSAVLPLNKNTKKSLMFNPVVIGIKVKGGYQMISKLAYVSNPGKAASNTSAYPVKSSKKGLQTSGEYLEDAINIGVNHVLFNVDLATVFSWKGEHNTTAYVHKGKTYYFKDVLSHPLRVQYGANDISISLVLLLSWRDDLKYLITPTGRQQGHHYYALNTETQKSREALEAVFSFLAETYEKNGVYVSNWILGNEVNTTKGSHAWNYAGNMSLDKYANSYAEAFRMLHAAVTSTSANQRVFISLDNEWTASQNGFSGKGMLDTFAKKIKEKNKNIKWNIAYHPYTHPLTSSRFWSGGGATNKNNTSYITFKNLNVLTNYVKKKYGSGTRIILSEQGFSSTAGEDVQAAALAYSYYIAEFNNMVDAVIYRSHIDNDIESAQGLRMGLWTNIPGTTRGGRKKKSWTVYKYMDTKHYATHTKFALKIINKSSWSKAVKGFKASKFKKS